MNKKQNKLKRFFLAGVVIFSLVVFNNHTFFALAEDGGSSINTDVVSDENEDSEQNSDMDNGGNGGDSNEESTGEESNTQENPEENGSDNGEAPEEENDADSEAQDNEGSGSTDQDTAQEDSEGENSENNEGESTEEFETPAATSSENTAPEETNNSSSSDDIQETLPEDEGLQEGNEDGNEDSVVVTGDADGEVDIENEVNSDETETETCGCECPEECECGEPEEECECPCECDCEIGIVNEDEAIVENNIVLEGETGENTAESNSGDSFIYTGNTNLVVALTNTVNTNIINSDFSNFLFNIFEFLQGDINISDILDNSISENHALSTTDCFDIHNENAGVIENNVFIEGSSGSNTATSEDGDAFINTGDVNVSASIFNLLNTNVIGSNWTNLIINVFDNWVGDLILPNKDSVQGFLDQPTACIGGCGASIINTSEGVVENEVSINADTGTNEAEGEDAVIYTGDSTVKSNIMNMVNTSSVGGRWLIMAINVFGGWKGNIFSLPPGLDIAEDINGIKIYNLDSDGFNNPAGNTVLDIVNDNTGFIKNSVIVNVSTGDNTAFAENGEAAIQTGNANVFSNLINILNSDLIGTNWLLGMINIFGTWEGNLAFGRPDLWIGESAITQSTPTQPGGTITYTLTYRNNGDADATGVVITDDFDERYISIKDKGGGTVIDNPGEIMWKIGTVPAGGSGSVSYTVTVNSDIPSGNSYLVNEATIDSYEDDWNDADNSDSLSVEVYKTVPLLWFFPKLEITKTNNTDYVSPPVNVGYTIVLLNNSNGAAYDVVVTDTILNEDSEVINTYTWDLGVVLPHEEITIDYTVAIGGEIPSGLYTNTAQAIGFGQLGNPVSSEIASTTIEVRNGELLSEEEATEPEESQEEPGVSIEEIEEKLDEIEKQIRIINEEIQRITPEPPAEKFVKTIVQEVLAEEETGEPETYESKYYDLMSDEFSYQKEYNVFGNLLAAVGQFLSDDEMYGIAFPILLLILLFWKRRDSEEESKNKKVKKIVRKRRTRTKLGH